MPIRLLRYAVGAVALLLVYRFIVEDRTVAA
jgi:hypothetical protein